MKKVLFVLVAQFGLAGCLAPSHGAAVHFDMPAKDPDKLGAFYSELAGWKVEKWQGSKGDPYWMVKTPSGGLFMDSINGGIFRHKGDIPFQYVIYLTTDNIDESVAKAKGLGASVAQEKDPIPEVGYIAILKDPEGNAFGFFQYAPDQATKDWDAAQAKQSAVGTPAK